VHGESCMPCGTGTHNAVAAGWHNNFETRTNRKYEGFSRHFCGIDGSQWYEMSVPLLQLVWTETCEGVPNIQLRGWRKICYRCSGMVLVPSAYMSRSGSSTMRPNWSVWSKHRNRWPIRNNWNVSIQAGSLYMSQFYNVLNWRDVRLWCEEGG
jgi:hypothetical protein